MKIDLFYDEREASTKLSMLEPLCFMHGGQEITIPASFVSDGASIPRFWWARVRPIDGRYLRAFLKHDFFYSALNDNVSRKKADRILYRDLREAGMGLITANEVYCAVRTFGKTAWEQGHEVK